MDEEKALVGDRNKRIPSKAYCSPPRWLMIVVAIVTSVIFVFALALGIGLGLSDRKSSSPQSSATYQHAAVATDAASCSRVGVDILRLGGNAVDAAIAATLCVGVVNLHSTGIGGGGFMVYYNSSSGEAHAIDFRERAPMNASTFMYNDTAPDASTNGGLAIAVPGQLHGLEAAWKKFSKLRDWKQLFAPAVELARDGFPITGAIARAIQAVGDKVLSGNYSGLRELLAPDGQLLKEGDILKQPQLADTLQQIAEHGIKYFYNSSFTETMVEELQRDYNSIIMIDDLHNYSSIERPMARAKYKDQEMLGMTPPSGGAVLGLILNILDGYNFKAEDFGILSYHRIVEAFKFTYAQRLKLGDPDFNDTIDQVVDYMLNISTAESMFNRIDDNQTHEPDYYMEPVLSGVAAHDHGTSHLCVLDENGDAVSLTSTINSYFGSLVRSKTSGIIFNDEMDDFSIPGRDSDGGLKISEPNYIQPGKRPLSSMTPTILLAEDQSVKMVVGASGGSKITTSVAQVVLDVLGFDQRLSESIPFPRLHHQLFPNHITIEDNFPQVYQDGLRNKGHLIEKGDSAIVQGIHVDAGGIHATSDPRKGGIPDGY